MLIFDLDLVLLFFLVLVLVLVQQLVLIVLEHIKMLEEGRLLEKQSYWKKVLGLTEV